MPDDHTQPAPNPHCNTSDPARALLAHNRWANDNLLETLSTLSDPQLDTSFPMGLGTLRKTFTHTLGAMRGWTDVLNKQPQRERLESHAAIGPAQWRDMVPTIHDELDAAAFAGPMNEVLSPDRQGATFHFIRAHVITHVTTHGVHHRAQALNMLRHLGAEDLPESAVVEWMLQRPGCTD